MNRRRHIYARGNAVRPRRAKLVVLGALIVAIWLLASTAQALPDGLAAEEYVHGLQFPVAMSVAPGGDILVTEKLGTVRLVRDGALREAPVVKFGVRTEGEAGLIGIDAFEDYEQTGRFAVLYTPSSDPHMIYVARARVTESGGEILDDPWIVLPGDPDTDMHFGGNLLIRDGYLYVSLGELHHEQRAQDTNVVSGSLLRFRDDGTVPQDNPFANAIYAYGFRNPFGFDVEADGSIWVADNGHHQHDEVSQVVRGGNYGWPLVMGFCDNYPLTEVCDLPGLIDPRYEFRYQTGVTGLVVYRGELMPQLDGDIFVGGWHSGEVHRLRAQPGQARLEQVGPFFIQPGGAHSHSDAVSATTGAHSEADAGADAGHQDAGSHDEGSHDERGATGITDVAVADDGALLALISGAQTGEIIRIAPREDILDAQAIVEEGTTRNTTDKPVCSISSVAPATSWSNVMLLLVCLGLITLALSRRRVPRGILAGACVMAVLTLWSARSEAVEFYVGAKVGADAAVVSGDNTVTAQFGPGIAGGLATRLQILDYLAVSPEFLYAMKGSGIDNVDERYISHQLTLPVLVEGMYDFGLVTPRLGVGAAGSYVLDASTAGISLTDKVQRWQFSLVGQVGVDFDFAASLLTVDVRYERGITEIYDDAATPAYLNTPENYDNVAYLLVGLLF